MRPPDKQMIKLTKADVQRYNHEHFKRMLKRTVEGASRLAMFIAGAFGMPDPGILDGHLHTDGRSRSKRVMTYTKKGPGRAHREGTGGRAHKTSGVPRLGFSVSLTDEQRFARGYMHASGERSRYIELMASKHGRDFANRLLDEMRDNRT